MVMAHSGMSAPNSTSLSFTPHTIWRHPRNVSQSCSSPDMASKAPTLAEITSLTRQELTTARAADPIRACGRAAHSLLQSDPDTCLELAYQKLHDVPYKELRICWRRLYTDASLWHVVRVVEARYEANYGAGTREGKDGEKGDWLDEVVKTLDMALILTGAPEREELVELWFLALKGTLPACCAAKAKHRNDSERPAKRRRLSSCTQTPRLPSSFVATQPKPSPQLRYPIPRTPAISLAAFQTKLSNISTHTPVVMEGAIDYWPALDERPWNDPAYLMTQTLGGRRLVPVEIGKSYTDDGWGQRIVAFREFMETYMFRESISGESDLPESDESGLEGRGEGARTLKQTGYLAQHDLFAQIPALRADISIPDYCYCDPAPLPHLTHIMSTPELEEPLLNAWFGPAGTVSPLHTDPYHNILAQVVGYKYVRLYAPSETEKLYPRSLDESGVDMSNTSQVDLDKAMAAWPETSCWCGIQEAGCDDDALQDHRKVFEAQFPNFKGATYVEAILAPGECLYLPVGWWHYISSLTPSFSVSFWFN